MRKGCARGTTRYFFHLYPSCGAPVIQSYQSPIFKTSDSRALQGMWRIWAKWGRFVVFFQALSASKWGHYSRVIVLLVFGAFIRASILCCFIYFLDPTTVISPMTRSFNYHGLSTMGLGTHETDKKKDDKKLWGRKMYCKRGNDCLTNSPDRHFCNLILRSAEYSFPREPDV